MEATTSAFCGTPTVDPQLDAQRDEQEINRQMEDVYPIRLGSALYSKLQKQYWKLPHVDGLPLVFAIQDFHEPQSLGASGASLWQYLYGIRARWYFDDAGELRIEEYPVNEHREEEKVVPSGFFSLPGAEHVSAVLFSNSGTVAKFNRMGYLAGYGRSHDIGMLRVGICYDHAPNTDKPKPFSYVVGDPDAPIENWAQGLTLYHNPNAVHPLRQDLLPFAYHFYDQDRLRSFLPDFYPYSSRTLNMMTKQ